MGFEWKESIDQFIFLSNPIPAIKNPNSHIPLIIFTT
jgi:hypothetical protein